MEASELRINNLVDYKDYGACRVKRITEGGFFDVAPLHMIGAISVASSETSPIPLTQEWLMRLGFYKSSFDNNEFIDSKTGWFMVYENSGYYKLSTGRGLIGEQFKYVHQLQNLYFALTGKELEINEQRKEQS